MFFSSYALDNLRSESSEMIVSPKNLCFKGYFLVLLDNDDVSDISCCRKFWTDKQRTAHAKSHTYQKVFLVRIDQGDQKFIFSQVGSLLSCPSCDYTCHKSTRLNNHMNAVHLGVKPFHCDQCPSAFPNRFLILLQASYF